jgi:hypothetical protein
LAATETKPLEIRTGQGQFGHLDFWVTEMNRFAGYGD